MEPAEELAAAIEAFSLLHLPSISKCAATAVSSQKRSRKNLIIN
jgi:hypothetical protein